MFSFLYFHISFGLSCYWYYPQLQIVVTGSLDTAQVSSHTFKLFETFAASVNNSCSLQIIHFRPSDSDVIWSRVERQFHCSNNTPLKWSHFLFQKSFLLSKEKRLFQRRQRVLLLSKINLIIKVLKPNSLVEGFLHSFHSHEECSKKSSVLTPWLHQSSIV